MRGALLSVVAVAQIGPGLAWAEPKTASAEATYIMAEADSRITARSKCMDKARQAALDEAGSVFEAAIETRQDEQGGNAAIHLQSHFAGIVATELVGDSVDLAGDQAQEHCRVRVTYDPESVAATLEKIADADRLRDQLAVQQAQIADLQGKLAAPPSGPVAMPVPRPAPIVAAPIAVPTTSPVYYAPPVGVVPARSMVVPPAIFVPAPLTRVVGGAPPMWYGVTPIYYPPPRAGQLAYRPADYTMRPRMIRVMSVTQHRAAQH